MVGLFTGMKMEKIDEFLSRRISNRGVIDTRQLTSPPVDRELHPNGITDISLSPLCQNPG